MSTNSSKQRPPLCRPITASNAIAFYDGGYEKESSVIGENNKNDEEYEYADEQEFWEPASRETELKLQLQKVLEIPVVRQDELQ